MKKRYMNPSAVFAVMIKDGKILLQKRKNTGYCDGYYDMAASGHVEKDESMMDALIREVREEIGIHIQKDNLTFMTLIHRHGNGVIYYDGYFLVSDIQEEPYIHEPEKCEELRWFPLDALPENLIDDRYQALVCYRKNIHYYEYG